MQTPMPSSYHSSSSIFEEILQEYSSQQLQLQLNEIQCTDDLTPSCQLEVDDKIEETSHLWLTIHQEPEENFICLNEEPKEEEMTLEIKKVQLSRHEQQIKLREMMQSHKVRNSKRNPGDQSSDFSLCKTSKSLSPRKTKKIDKKYCETIF